MMQGHPTKERFPSLGSKGWRSGESACLPSMWPGFKSRCRRYMWVEFAVDSLVCSERFFAEYSNSTRYQVDEEPLCGCATSKSLFIYIYLFLFKYVRNVRFKLFFLRFSNLCS